MSHMLCFSRYTSSDSRMHVSPRTEPDSSVGPLLRVCEAQQALRPGLRTGVPLELYDTSDGSALAQFIARQRAQEREEDDQCA